MAKMRISEQETYLKELIEYGDRIKTDVNLVDKILKTHMEKIPNKKLYKFRTCTNQNLKILEENCIWMPAAKTFKDTFDGAINIDLKENASKIEEWLQGNFLNLFYIFFESLCKTKGVELNFTFQDFKEYNDTCMTKSGEVLLEQEYSFLKKFFTVEKLDDYETQIKQMRMMRKQFEDQLNSNIDSITQNILEEINLKRSYLRDRMLTYCMTERYDNNNLWENYADDYKGFCIEYCFDNFQSKPFDDYKNLIFLLPMIYRKRTPYFDIVPFIDQAMRKSILQEKGFEYDSDLLTSLNMQMFYKNKDYEPEHEWRFSIQNKENNKQPFPFVSALYAGKDIKPRNLSRLLNIGVKLKVPVYKQEFNCAKNGYEYKLVEKKKKYSE